MRRIAGLMLAAILSILIGCEKMGERNMYGFTVQNWKAVVAGFPKEDAFAFDEEGRVACVADGITRDFSDGTAVRKDGLSNKVDGFVKTRFRKKYPGYAVDVSRIAVNTFMLDKSLQLVNKDLWDYNFNVGLVPSNYRDKDLAGCTFAGVFEEDGRLYWQFIADSGVAVVRNGELVFKTPNEGPNSKGSITNAVKSKYDTGFNEAEGRRIIRSLYRNNPEEPLAYGALTGEQEALHYIREGREEISAGDYVLLFTDGVGDMVFDGGEIKREYLEKILEGDSRKLERLCKKNVSTEGTLVVWKIE